MTPKKNNLFELQVLVVDCQATRADPQQGDLLEIGWLSSSAAAVQGQQVESQVITHLVDVPEGKEIPRRVQRLTGISPGDGSVTLSPKKAWKKLLRVAKRIASANPNGRCPTVIHYSRFEEAYLHHLHQQWSARSTFPFEIICTHRLSKLLLPHLPGKGLRAVAGYFDWPVPELRRCASHIAATAFTWHKLVALLAESYNVHTLEELSTRMEDPGTFFLPAGEQPSGSRFYPMAPAIRSGLPGAPGVYRMLRANGDLLYIGKATSLRQRVNSYFRDSTKHSSRTLEMLTQAKDLEYTITSSVVEAAMLESDLIKQHTPPYNIALKPRDRSIIFLSRDLQGGAAQADERHTIGPLPSNPALVAFANLIQFLSHMKSQAFGKSALLEPKDEDIAALLGLHPDYAPGIECFLEGIDISWKRHGLSLDIAKWNQDKQESILHSFMRLGKELQRQKLAELAAARAAAEEEAARLAAEKANQPAQGTTGIEQDNAASEENIDSETGPGGEIEEEPGGDVWTPEAAAAMIESIIRFGSRLIRRSRWFCLLSESSITWEETVEKQTVNIRVSISAGQAVNWTSSTPGSEILLPEPSGYRRSFAQRREIFDVATYDRLRVMMTEIHRMINSAGARSVRLRFGPRVEIGQEKLMELLQWI